MALLAFKALSNGADKIPDKFFEAIPGGFFTPAERKKTKTDRNPIRDNRNQSEQRQSNRDKRRSYRDRTPPTDYSDYSGYDDTDYEKEYRERQRRRRHRRTKSLGGSPDRDRGFSRGRHRERSQDLDGEFEMDRAERGPDFPPPPTSEFRQYNPAEYVPSAGGNEYYDQRNPSARPDYGYPPQVNSTFRTRSSTAASTPPFALGDFRPPLSTSVSPGSPLSPSFPGSPTWGSFSCSSPLQLSFSPSFEPPLATILHKSGTNSPQPSDRRASTAQQRYTPGPGYSPSPVNAPVPPSNTGYAPYNPADYAPPQPGSYSPNPSSYRAPGNTYPSPPPFYRQQSRSQPSLAQYPYPDNQLTYPEPPGHHDSNPSSRHHHHHGGDGKHRARSADHRRSRSRVTDKFRDRFDDMNLDDKNLAASVGGALAGGLAGRAVGHGTLSTLVGAAIGGFGGRELEKRHEK